MNKIREWNQKWSERKNQQHDPNPLLVRLVNSVSPGHALDLAGGIGRNAFYLAQNGWLVDVIDGSEVAIRILQERAGRLGLQVNAQLIDLESEKFQIKPNTFDLICMLFYLQRDLLAQARENLKSGGYLIAAVHMKDDTHALEPRNAGFLMEPGELEREFEGWEIQHYLEGRSTDPNHERPTAEIIARKTRTTRKP